MDDHNVSAEEIMTKEAGTVQLRELVKKLIPESIGKETFWVRDCAISKAFFIKIMWETFLRPVGGSSGGSPHRRGRPRGRQPRGTT